MSDLPGPIEWTGEKTVLVRATSTARGVNFPFNYRRSARYYEAPSRRISKIFVHQTAGAPRDGYSACVRLAEWITRSPKFEARGSKRVRVGGGRGFPGAPYTFMIPHRPDIHEGKSVVYRLWDDDWVTWHTRRNNKIGVGVAFAGSFRTRHMPNFSDRQPTSMAMDAGAELIAEYLMPRYAIESWDDVCGHFDAGKPTCPGDDLEAWIRTSRGETVGWLDQLSGSDRRPLESMEQKRQALVDLGRSGFDLASRDDFRLAVESVQDEAGIVIDGIWGPQTERAVRALLAA